MTDAHTNLIINLGSASKKFACFRSGRCLMNAHYEHTADGFVEAHDGASSRAIDQHAYDHALSHFADTVRAAHGLPSDSAPALVGLRLVSPGRMFAEHRIFDEPYEAALREVAAREPAHLMPSLDMLDEVRATFPGIPVLAISDSAFHRTLPDRARIYALPRAEREAFDIEHFGYHGLSMGSIAHTLSERPGGTPRRTVVCHLGSGASITALLEGKSIDTSMGYSPLDGLIMSSRCGALDPGAVLRLAEEKNADELTQLFYKRSGLLALSELSNDMRVLLDNEATHANARMAVEAFVYRVQTYVGAYAVALGGLDALVFSGTIGERSAPIREKICAGLGVVGVTLDDEKNAAPTDGDDIATAESTARVLVLRTDETAEMARIMDAWRATHNG